MGNDRPQRPFVKRIGLVSVLAAGLAAGAALAPLGHGLPTFGQAHAQAITPSGGPASFSPVVKAVAPAVVHIEVTAKAGAAEAPSVEDLPPGMREFFERFFGDRMPQGAPGPQRPRTGLGSGFIIDAEGHVFIYIPFRLITGDCVYSILAADENRWLQMAVVALVFVVLFVSNWIGQTITTHK